MEGRNVEDVFAPRGRIRVLTILAEAGELNISEIMRRSRMNHGKTVGHLVALKEAGLVREKRFGAIRIFELAFRSLRVSLGREKELTLEMEL